MPGRRQAKLSRDHFTRSGSIVEWAARRRCRAWLRISIVRRFSSPASTVSSAQPAKTIPPRMSQKVMLELSVVRSPEVEESTRGKMGKRKCAEVGDFGGFWGMAIASNVVRHDPDYSVLKERPLP